MKTPFLDQLIEEHQNHIESVEVASYAGIPETRKQLAELEAIKAITVAHSSLQLKTIFKVGDYVIYRGVINAKIIEVLEHNFYKIEDSNNDIMKAYTSSLELQ